jgi:midasin
MASPESLRIIASKPAKSLNVWEKSLLAAYGRLREDDSTLAMLSLYPTMVALGGLISRLLSVDLLSLDPDDRDVSGPIQFSLARSDERIFSYQAAIGSSNVIRSLSIELQAVSRSGELDFSSIQHIASWIAMALQQVPLSLTDLASDARLQLAPLSNSLILTTGKEMSNIWKACLPYRPSSSIIAAAYQKLMARGNNSAGEVWDTGELNDELLLNIQLIRLIL